MQLALVIANIRFFAVGGDNCAEELVEKFDGLDVLTAVHIPNARRFVGRCGKDLIVGGEGDALHGATMADKRLDDILASCLPNLDGLVGRA